MFHNGATRRVAANLLSSGFLIAEKQILPLEYQDRSMPKTVAKYGQTFDLPVTKSDNQMLAQEAIFWIGI